MDLLLSNYASSSEEEGESSSVHGDHRQQQMILATEELEKRKQAIARRFAERAKRAARAQPMDTSGFAFRPFVAKRQKLDEQAARSEPPHEHIQDLSPLFASPASIQMRNERAPIRLPSGHSGPVYCVQWNVQAPRLFLSASMDSSVRVWRLEGATASTVRVLQRHNKGVKSAKWTLDGRQVLSGGFDHQVLQTDVETATVVQRVEHGKDECITSVCMHPTDPDLVLIGSDKGRIYRRDLRARPDAIAAVYKSTFADVHDLLFLPQGDRFVSSSGIKTRDTSNQTLLVWDARSSTLLFDRLDLDFMAHSCLRLHPAHRYFVAQCSGNYGSVYTATAPYKRLYVSKNKSRPRVFQGGHQVAGYSIQCSFSADGAFLASGDANGRLVVYGSSSRSVVTQLQLYSPTTPCLASEFHPHDPQTLVTSSYEGQLHLLRYNDMKSQKQG